MLGVKSGALISSDAESPNTMARQLQIDLYLSSFFSQNTIKSCVSLRVISVSLVMIYQNQKVT